MRSDAHQIFMKKVTQRVTKCLLPTLSFHIESEFEMCVLIFGLIYEAINSIFALLPFLGSLEAEFSKVPL